MSNLTIEVKNDAMLGRMNDKALHITLIEQQKEIERLNKELEFEKLKNKEVREYTESHFKQMVADEEAQKLLEVLDKVDKKDITIPLEELESYETKNIYEEAEQDYFWSKE